jgi:hypothetical protein
VAGEDGVALALDSSEVPVPVPPSIQSARLLAQGCGEGGRGGDRSGAGTRYEQWGIFELEQWRGGLAADRVETEKWHRLGQRRA